MPFEIPSFDELRQFLIASFAGRFPNKNVNRYSGLYKRLSVVALGILDNHYHIRQVGLDVMPDTAEDDQLDRHADIWGVPRKGAVGAARSGALRVFGTFGETVPNLEPMIHVPSGLLFETRNTAVVGLSGYVDVDVASTNTGEVTNLEVGEELQFQTVPTGLEANARIVVELEGGLDQESDPDLRDRLLKRIGQSNAGGNRSDYEDWVLESAGFVASAYVYPNRNGQGSVDLAALKSGTGSARLLSLSERQEVFDYVDALRPVTATIRVLEVTTGNADVEVAVLAESDPIYSFDWSDETPPVVQSYISGTRTVTVLGGVLPVDMAVGDRVVFADTSLGGRQWVIESIPAAGQFTLTEDPGSISGGNIYSGGPLVDPVRDAIQAAFDELGTANPDGNPYGDWNGNVRHSNLFEIAQTTTGVLDSSIVLPASSPLEANDPPFPANTSVEVLVASSIIVRSFSSAGL